jgi:hypothetical protein
MVVAQYQRAIGVLTTRQDAELALNELRESGFSMTKVGVLTKDSSGDNRHSRVNSEKPRWYQKLKTVQQPLQYEEDAAFW